MSRKSDSQSRILKISLKNQRHKRSESSDQLYLDFGDSDEISSLRFADSTETVEDCFHRGCVAEEQGRLPDAIVAYRRAQEIGGQHAAVSFNMANVLFALGDKTEAVHGYQEAVTLQPAYCEAWNNLGVALAEVDDLDAALAALRKAISLNPHCADARYNLADLLDSLNRRSEAREHWQAYLRSAPETEWTEYAQSRLLASDLP